MTNGPRLVVHLVNPSEVAFGTAVVTPRWLYVLAGATPERFGDPHLVDETLAPLELDSIAPNDVVGIGIHTGNTMRGYEVGRLARERGAYVVFGGIHATLFPEEAFELGGAHAVVKGDGDVVWPTVVEDCMRGDPQRVYAGGRIEADDFAAARWDLMPAEKYMWASVQTVRGCPKHCSFCSVWRTDGQKPRQRQHDAVIRELVELRRLGFKFNLLADDNFYPVTLKDLELAARQNNHAKLAELTQIRNERFQLMERMAKLPKDMTFFTQITMEAAEDPEFLKAMRQANIRGVLVGVEAVTPEGLKDVYKDFNYAGEELVEKLQAFRKAGVFVLGSFIFGLPSDRAETFEATAIIAERAELAFGQFVPLTAFPGTVDFERLEKDLDSVPKINGVPVTRRWLIPKAQRLSAYVANSHLTQEELRLRTQGVWDRFYSFPKIWKRSAKFTTDVRGRLAFLLISKVYRQMYADTGLATDSARVAWTKKYTKYLAMACAKLFKGRPMPELQVPQIAPAPTSSEPLQVIA
jgi:radical SAM superfamily enzyme YgiQ (UPF0313 family)